MALVHLLARARPPAPDEHHILGPLAPRRRPPVGGLVVSLLVHALLVLLAVGVAREATPVLERLEERPVAVPPMLLPPPVPPPEERAVAVPEPEPEPQPPPPPPTATVDEPEDDLPVVEDPGDEPAPAPDENPAPPMAVPADAPPTPLPPVADAAPSPQPTTPATRAPSMEAEARRIFGGPRRRGRGTAEGTEEGRPLPPALSNGECPYTIPPAVPGEPVRMTSATGRVLREGTDMPLEGALLQVIGTPYSTMSGTGGSYTLTIPLELVANCRVQYVRVVASGYRSRLLPLTLGQAPVSDDVRLRRR